MSMAEDIRGNRYNEPNEPYAQKPANDPLAELARLIGQGDPFADPAKRNDARKTIDSFNRQDRPAPEWLNRPAAKDDSYEMPRAASLGNYGARDPYAAAPRDDYGHDQHGYQDSQQAHDSYAAQGEPHDAHDAKADAYKADAYKAEPYKADADKGEQYDDQNYDPQYAATESSYHGEYSVARPGQQDYDETYYDGHMPPGEEAPASRKRGGLITIAAVVGLAVIGTVGAFGYRAFTGGSSGGTPPVIKADPTPAKTMAAQPAAAVDAQGKPFQERVGAPERVVSREEAPVAVQSAPRQVGPPAFSTQPAASAPATNSGEPKRVKTMTIRPDGADPTPPQAAPSQQRVASNAPVAGLPAPRTVQTTTITNSAPSGSAPMAIAPNSQKADTKADSRTKVAARTPPAASGAYAVQVSAQKTEAEAQSSYRALQQKYPSVLAGREASIKRADLSSGTYYRAQVGSFATFDAATAFCNSLKDAGGQCIVQKN